jgi:hypothetical protein
MPFVTIAHRPDARPTVCIGKALAYPVAAAPFVRLSA